jgi:hypothetical protein
MVDLLQQAASWLSGQRAAFLSRSVVYSRGEGSVIVQAGVGKTTFDVDDGYGGIVRFESRDFLIAASDLVLAGEVFNPQRGDRISDGSQVYEVMAPGKEDVCRPSDSYGVTWRIHTKQVGSS